MKRFLIFAFLIFAAGVSLSRAQDGSVDGARDVLLQIAQLSRQKALQTEAARRILTGELTDLKADSFGRLADAPDKILPLDKTHAVGRFQFTGDDNHSEDVYFYLRFENGWKIYALRALALPKFLRDYYAILKSKPDSTEEEKRELANLKLLFASDAELKNWFAENRRALEKFAVAAQSKKGKNDFYVGFSDKNSPEAAQLREMNLSLLSVKTNGNVEIVIGGITDNTVGFLYSPAKTPPAVSTLEYIWVEEIAPGWYLFRTT
jgi:hypothetical protein